MSNHIVIEHVRDDSHDLYAGVENPIREDGSVDRGEKLPGGVYRLIIGIPVYDDIPIDKVVDPDNGEVIEDARTERVLVDYSDVREFLFAEADERWDGKSPGEIASIQRKLVADSLEPVESEAAPSTEVLPGIGEPLA